MSNYQSFIFKNYVFDSNSKILKLTYGYDDALEFTEEYKFDFDFVDYNEELLDKLLQSLFFMAGISYYKAYYPTEIIIKKGKISREAAQFLDKTYQKGLGEFFYVNKIDPNLSKDLIKFPVNETENKSISNANSNGLLIGIGGGKDSLVSVEILKKYNDDITTWSLSHRSQLEPLVNVIDTRHLWVDRRWDRSLLELNKSGALNGHIPISSIFACVGSVVAVLSGKKEVVVSNENSANEPSLTYMGVPINHQYSKSLEFEKDYQSYLNSITNSPIYYSFLRPLSEVYIAEIFARVGFDKYKSVFSSCNRAFTHDSNHISWCGKCPKCAFTFLALTPFVARPELENIWHKNLLQDPSLEGIYKNILGIDGDKPLDCVGEVKESRTAMKLAQIIYPELSKYKFEIPENYDYQAFSSHSMPEDRLNQLKDGVNGYK